MKNHTEIKLWKHQSDAVVRAEPLNYFGLWFEAGAGKTASAIHMVRAKMNKHRKLLPTVILCPPVVVENWKRELLMHSKIPESLIHCLTGPGVKRLKEIQGRSDGVFITNYEALLMEPLFKEFSRLLSASGSILICDELHRCKDPSAKRTKKAFTLSELATYRYGLTGTPVLNSLMDVFSQMKILDGGESFGSNFFTFRARFFYDRNKGMPKHSYFPDWVPTKNAESIIRARMEEVGMYVAKKDCMDLPPLVKKVIDVELSPEQRRLYASMKKDLIATMESPIGTVVSVAELAITKALRLQQIVSGHLRVEHEGETKTVTIKDNPRKDALRDLLTDLVIANKVIIWSVFKDNYDDIKDVCDKLKVQYVEIHGGVSNKQEAADKFNNDPDVKVLIGHPGSGGIGINLIAANTAIYYSRNFSLEQRLQSEARNFRGGSEIHDKITLIDLVAKGTIDELVLKALENKQELSDRILKEHISEL